jgi:hypothetical protein
MALIKCKHIEHVAQKELIDLRMHMIPTIMWWNKIAKELLKLIHNKIIRNEKMCKDKWNRINSNYKNFFYYDKSNRRHASFWELTANELNRYGLSQSFNKKY